MNFNTIMWFSPKFSSEFLNKFFVEFRKIWSEYFLFVLSAFGKPAYKRAYERVNCLDLSLGKKGYCSYRVVEIDIYPVITRHVILCDIMVLWDTKKKGNWFVWCDFNGNRFSLKCWNKWKISKIWQRTKLCYFLTVILRFAFSNRS